MFQICLEDLKERLMISLIIDDQCRDVWTAGANHQKSSKGNFIKSQLMRFDGIEWSICQVEGMGEGKSHFREHEARKLHWKISSECISDGRSVPWMVHNWLFTAYAENDQYVCTVFNTAMQCLILKSKSKRINEDIYQVKPEVCCQKLVPFILRCHMHLSRIREVWNISNQLLTTNV